MNAHTFIVWDANNKPNTWRFYYVDDKPPECECGIFISTKIRLNKFNGFLYQMHIYSLTL